MSGRNYRKKGQARTLDEALSEGLDACIEVGDCLEWQGTYGSKRMTAVPIVRVRLNGRTAGVAVARELWQRANGPVPTGRLVYRSCCNNRCVQHLACGTHAQWMAARKRLGLTRHHSTTVVAMTAAARRRPTVVNSLELARAVRQLAGDGLADAEISLATGVSMDMTRQIRRGDSWADQLVGSSVFSWRPA